MRQWNPSLAQRSRLMRPALGGAGAVTTRQAQITRVLNEAADPRTGSRLLPLVYDELRELAQARLAKEAPGQTLQATALVHEAYLRLFGDGRQSWDSRGHFFAAVAEAMRRILVERARRRDSAKHGGGWQRITLSGVADEQPEAQRERVLALDQALSQLEELNPARSEVVKLRFFAGLTIDQTADVLQVSPATVRRHWTIARAWLASRMPRDKTAES